MSVPERLKTCPIAPAREDGTPGICREEKCAWWAEDACAIVKMANSLDKTTKK
ncbi:MAG: hypothetical protein U9N44_08265 [Chloroflexota bacterium]|nr:hypothetical protein [Chloroflexota bacterium]